MRSALGLLRFLLFFAIVSAAALACKAPLYLQGEQVRATEHVESGPHPWTRMHYQLNGTLHDIASPGADPDAHDGRTVWIAVDPDQPGRYVAWTVWKLLPLAACSAVVALVLAVAVPWWVRRARRAA